MQNLDTSVSSLQKKVHHKKMYPGNITPTDVTLPPSTHSHTMTPFDAPGKQAF